MTTKKKAVWEAKIVRRAAWYSVLKLNPRKMMTNPVMFVVEIGSVITTALLFRGGSDFKRPARVVNRSKSIWNSKDSSVRPRRNRRTSDTR